MAVWKELGRFLERSAPLLDEARASLQESRDALVALKPSIEALPELVRETHLLVVEVRKTATALGPLLVELAKKQLESDRHAR